MKGWLEAFQLWCPINIVNAKKAPKLNHIRECYKTAFEAGFKAGQRETAEACAAACVAEKRHGVVMSGARLAEHIKQRFGLKEARQCQGPKSCQYHARP